MNKRRTIAIVVFIVLVLASLAFLLRDTIIRQIFRPTETTLDRGINSDDADIDEAVEVFVENLTVPWAFAFLPDGDMLVTERPGTLKRIGTDQTTLQISGVEHVGEGGLLGVALHPDFEDNRWVYLYLTSEVEGGLINRIERYRFEDNALSVKITIFDNIPGARFHDGGRIAFGPDDHLYVTTGDAGDPDAAQDRDSIAGKTLRITDEGSVPEDNPFGTAVYSYGHRNAQGMAWDDQDRLWQTEHGSSGQDELNLIEPGINYGWPVITGDETQADMRSPVTHSGSDETWAPTGMAYHEGSLYFAGLRGESLYQATIQEDDSVSIKTHFRGDYGRLRAVALGPDGYLYVSTSNTDGRGETQPNDDRIIRINPAVFDE